MKEKLSGKSLQSIMEKSISVMNKFMRGKKYCQFAEFRNKDYN